MTREHAIDTAGSASATHAIDPLVSVPLLSAAEVAELFSVHPSTIRRQAREGHLPAYWVGSTPRFSLNEVASTFRMGANPSRRRPPPRRTSPPSMGPSAQRETTQLDRKRLRADLYG